MLKKISEFSMTPARFRNQGAKATAYRPAFKKAIPSPSPTLQTATSPSLSLNTDDEKQNGDYSENPHNIELAITSPSEHGLGQAVTERSPETIPRTIGSAEEISTPPTVDIGTNQVNYGRDSVPVGVAVSPKFKVCQGCCSLEVVYTRGPAPGPDVMVPDLSRSQGQFVQALEPSPPRYKTGSLTIPNLGYSFSGPSSARGLLWGLDQRPGGHPTPYWIGYLDVTAWSGDDSIVLTYVETLLFDLGTNTSWSLLQFPN